MRCQDYRRYLGPYIDSELDARTCADIAEHLSLCEGCSRLFAQEQEIERRLVKGLQREKMPEESWSAIYESLSAHDFARPWRVRLAWLVPAAVVPVAAMLLVWFFLLGKPPDAGSLAKPLLEAHEKHLTHELALGPGLSWPQELSGLKMLQHLPQSGVMGGHDIKLIGGQPCYIKKIKGAHVVYTCCNTPVSMFILRKEDMDKFKGAQRLLDKGKGSAIVDLGNMRLAMKDLKEAVVCSVSSHDTSELMTAFEHL